MKDSKIKGFTLIELLVVISIISLLSSIVLVSLNNVKAKARDAVRKSNIVQINKAIQLYIFDEGHAPDLGRPECIDTSIADYSCIATNTDSGSWALLANDLKPYLSPLPKDPCGSACKIEGSNPFAYFYGAPASLVSHYQNLNLNINSSEYLIGAQNTEFGDVFKIGLGSF